MITTSVSANLGWDPASICLLSIDIDPDGEVSVSMDVFNTGAHICTKIEASDLDAIIAAATRVRSLLGEEES